MTDKRKPTMDRLGPGFSADEIKSPLYVGPSEGQEGWTPANPEIPETHDPLGYVPAEVERRDRY
jgi:hypothetical protein